MHLQELTNQSILFLGKSAALSPEEFLAQLQLHNITLKKEMDSDVVAVVEGRMMTPYETNLRDEVYAQKTTSFVELQTLETALCENINMVTLHMSLKLSGDEARLLGFLKNPLISDALFLRLLTLYNYKGESFFENDENRDVTAALIKRFYKNIERNHNVQYANTGIMHLLDQSDNGDLIEVITALEPIQSALKKGSDNATQKIVIAIADHLNASEKVLSSFVKYANTEIASRIAFRSDLSPLLQQRLFDRQEAAVLETLSCNQNLSLELVEKLRQDYAQNIAHYHQMDEALFDLLIEDNPLAMASNETLTFAMQRKVYCYTDDVQQVLAENPHIDKDMAFILFESNKPPIKIALAKNPATPVALLQQMQRDKSFYKAIASNAKTPPDLLKGMAQSDDIEVLLALAKNPATPVELLYQFQLDNRLERAVKENSAFGEHIQRENIGWEV